MSYDLQQSGSCPIEIDDLTDRDETSGTPENGAAKNPYRPPCLALLGDITTLNGTAPAVDIRPTDRRPDAEACTGRP